MGNKILLVKDIEAQQRECNSVHIGFHNVEEKLTNSFDNVEKSFIRSGGMSSILILEVCRMANSRISETGLKFELAANLLRTAIQHFQNLDTYLSGRVNAEEWLNTMDLYYAASNVDIKKWSEYATDAEYARLCSFCNDVTAAECTNSKAAFLEKLKTLPEGDPLRDINPDNVDVVDYTDSGMSAIVLTDENGNATVIFAGTNGDGGDFSADLALGLGLPSRQLSHANYIIDELSTKYNNITVSGHSLGGYLAVNVALNNENVSKCVAFDPPGQGPKVLASAMGGTLDFSNITTYVTQGLINKMGGVQVGNVQHIDVTWQMTNDNGNFALDRTLGHNIDDIYNALGGNETVEFSWKYYDYQAEPIDNGTVIC